MHQVVGNQRIAWEPGFWRRAPWKAVSSILAFVVCCAGLAAILVDSNGKEVNTWPRSSMPVSVPVLLSLIVGFANLCLTIALSQAYEVAWWLNAMRGAELRRLQFDLDIQHNLSALFGPSRTVDKFAVVAAISLVVSIVDGPLIQRASTITPNAYESHYEFLAATLACVVLQALAIATLLVGWQRLCRQVSLDAFEMSKALEEPLLQNGSSNGTIDDVLARVGRVPLRYGEILPVEGPIPVMSQHLKESQGTSVAGSGDLPVE
ncbi:hypothetical protein VE03_03882 [Pseudogymnoascus sp. 23342-1-I1]|nr:hypothetical protein VE03_03882 [Pseudogymnoascus sp. 23342-1-I1]